MTTTFPYSSATELEYELELTADTVRECIMNGESYAEPIDFALAFIQANWGRFSNWVEQNQEPDGGI